MSVALTARDRARLKARAHALEPLVQIGHAGLTDALVGEIDRALAAHELIKVRAGSQDREARAQLYGEICARTGASPVQQVGKVLVLWRKKPDADG